MRRSARGHAADPRRRRVDPDRHARHLLRAAALGRRRRPDRRGHRDRAARRRPLAARGGRDARPRADPLPPRPRGRARLHAGAARRGRAARRASGGRARRCSAARPTRCCGAPSRRRSPTPTTGWSRARCGSWRSASSRWVRSRSPPRRQEGHSTPTLALRFDDLLTYCTDTPYDAGNAELARGSRVLLHEAWATEGAPEQTRDPLLRPRGRARGRRGGRRAARAHPPAPADRRTTRCSRRRGRSSRPPSSPTTGSRSSSSPRPSRARRPPPTGG